MRLISRKALLEFARHHPFARKALLAWAEVVEAVDWGHFSELRATYPSADSVGRLTVFNVGGNKYRVVARITYQNRTVYIRAVLTHEQYDRGGWKDDPWA